MAVFPSANPDSFMVSGGTTFAGTAGAPPNSFPSITTEPSSQTVTEGSSTSFNSGYTGGDAPVTTSWESSPDGGTWTTVPGFTNLNTLILSNVLLSQSGMRYRFKAVDNDSDTVTSSVAFLTVIVTGWTSGPLLIGAGGFITQTHFSQNGW